MPRPICSVPDCGRPNNAQGYCHGHYWRWQKYGDPLAHIPLITKRPKGMSLVEAFRYYMPEEPPLDGSCWEWAGPRDKRKGYGVLKLKGFQHRAHRVAYELFVAPIPDELLACHHCDNPPCCNPEHLYPGTIRQNSHDMAVRDRSTRGERNAMAKLTRPQVDDIRSRYVPYKVTHKMLAEEYGVTPGAIRAIIAGITWRPVRVA